MPEQEFYTVRGYQLLEQHKSSLTASLEDYLEMICRSMLADGYVRVNKLSAQLNVKPSSASKMLMKLNNLGLIEYEKYGVVRLTEHGRNLGQYLLWRHNTILKFLKLISNENEGDIFIETELSEHIFGKNTVMNFERLIKFLNGADIKKLFKDYLKTHN